MADEGKTPTPSAEDPPQVINTEGQAQDVNNADPAQDANNDGPPEDTNTVNPPQNADTGGQTQNTDDEGQPQNTDTGDQPQNTDTESQPQNTDTKRQPQNTNNNPETVQTTQDSEEQQPNANANNAASTESQPNENANNATTATPEGDNDVDGEDAQTANSPAASPPQQEDDENADASDNPSPEDGETKDIPSPSQDVEQVESTELAEEQPAGEGRTTNTPQPEEEGTNAPPPTADGMKARESTPPKEEMAEVKEESPSVAEEKAATLQQMPASRSSVRSQSVQAPSNALNLSWSFGVNKNVPTINLTDHHRKMVLYTCGNTAILYDYAKNTQRLLQGHSNDICCTCTSQDKRWVVTADKGINSMVIIWDSYTGTPVQTIFDAYPDIGVACMAMTADAKYLVTISASPAQTVSLWDWTTDGERPICSCELSERYGLQSYVYFNPEDTTQLVSNSDNQVIFYSWKGGEFEFFAPPLTDQDFNRAVGSYSQSIFCINSSRALTATSVGNVVVWDSNRPNTGVSSLEPSLKKKAFKLVRLQEKGITVLTTTDRYVVTGDVSGHVKFYDQQLRMSNWYNEFGVGPINSISFAYASEFTPLAREDSDYPPDATINASHFVTRNYTISTTTAQIALIVADGSKVKMIQAEHDAAIHSMAAHPTEPFIAIGSYSGLLKIWNYKTKTLVASRMFPRGHLVRCLAFDPKGMYLGVGFTNGYVYILDSLTLDDEVPEPFRYSRDAVTHCTFSLDSQWMATADADYCVTLFKREKADSECPWTYLGKHRAHYKPIRGLSFGLKLDTTAPRLISVGEDRSLVEYDLINSGIDDLKLIACDRIEQSAIPQCITWHPPITKEQFFLLADDQYKFKLYNTTTKMCRKTLLGPTYGTPLQKIEVLPTANEMEDDKRYLAYITTDKVGLHIMPLDGNPHNAIARIAHPSGVTNMVCSHDGKHVFTAGGSDASVSMWDVAMEVLEAGSQLGGEGLIPFYGLLEGGRDGELFKELENYFYYAQIRSQGVDTMSARDVSTQIPLSEIPFVMRAMGHYPSEQEIEDMINEIKFSRYVDTGEYVSHIDLGTFIKLYVNHRPAFGLSATKLYEAFEMLGLDEYMGAPAIDRGELLELLQTKGEHMTEAEVAEYITTLLGLNPEGGSSELGSYDASGAADVLEEALPEQVTADMFTSEVLGFGGPVEVSIGSASTTFE